MALLVPTKAFLSRAQAHGHAFCVHWVHPPTFPYPALSAHAEPVSKGHCWKWHHEAESLM